MIQEQTMDAYTWGALYDDDSCIGEYDRLEGRGFAEVEIALTRAILLIPLAGGATHHVSIPQGATPVFFRRRSITIDPLQGETGNRTTTHCIGWKRGDEAVYLFVFEDGSTLLTDNLQAV